MLSWEVLLVKLVKISIQGGLLFLLFHLANVCAHQPCNELFQNMMKCLCLWCSKPRYIFKRDDTELSSCYCSMCGPDPVLRWTLTDAGQCSSTVLWVWTGLLGSPWMNWLLGGNWTKGLRTVRLLDSAEAVSSSWVTFLPWQGSSATPSNERGWAQLCQWAHSSLTQQGSEGGPGKSWPAGGVGVGFLPLWWAPPSLSSCPEHWLLPQSHMSPRILFYFYSTYFLGMEGPERGLDLL